MPQAFVNIGGRSYRLACNPGEEPHLESLAKFVDGKIDEMRTSFGEIGDQRITVMAALSIADELFEAKRKLDNHAGEASETLDQEKATRAAAEARAEALMAEVDEMAARVEAMTASLSAPVED
jgi:cell division protein ZapA